MLAFDLDFEVSLLLTWGLKRTRPFVFGFGNSFATDAFCVTSASHVVCPAAVDQCLLVTDCVFSEGRTTSPSEDVAHPTVTGSSQSVTAGFFRH